MMQPEQDQVFPYRLVKRRKGDALFYLDVYHRASGELLYTIDLEDKPYSDGWSIFSRCFTTADFRYLRITAVRRFLGDNDHEHTRLYRSENGTLLAETDDIYFLDLSISADGKAVYFYCDNMYLDSMQRSAPGTVIIDLRSGLPLSEANDNGDLYRTGKPCSLFVPVEVDA